MDRARKERIEALFEAALEREPAARDAWLVEASAGDEALLDEARRLLAAHERPEGILDMPAAAAPWARDPERVGAYRLVREIGRGGMGTVYLAERADEQFRQQVAVKLLRRGLESPELVARFVAERQILASLQHANIARLLDGGVTGDGRPYLVMEHIEGEPLDVYCDRRQLGIEDRLRLFCVVARAVHHAHRNLVVHRDLKPSNILVTAQGYPKLLDFGIAKLLDADQGPAGAPRTRTGLRLMTPEYASPEQVRGGPVTTATDVYALGLVLYELLAGRRPYRLEGRSATDVERVVCLEEPSRPSTAAVRVDDPAAGEGPGVDPAVVARARCTTPERLRRKLAGDLDRIVLMALRKEPERRYPSAEQLAEDIERHLDGRPVIARGDSALYRVGKFARRHRWAVAAANAFLLLLAGYAVTATVKTREVEQALARARLEHERAEQVTAFLLRLFEASDPGEALGDSVTARELLVRGLKRAEQLEGQPSAQAQMLDVVGRVYQHLGQYERAQPLLERALALRRQAYGEEHASVAESQYSLAVVHYERGRWDEAELLFRRAAAVQRRLLGAEHPALARTLTGLSDLLRDRGDYGAAETLARQALDMRRRLLGNEHLDVAESLSQLAALRQRNGNYAGAEPLYREALDMRRRLLGRDHPDVAESLNSLALALHFDGRNAEAEPLYREAYTMYRRLLGADHPSVAGVMSNLALLLRQEGRLDEAEPLFREALAIRQRRLGAEHPDVALSMGLLAALLRRKADFDAAEQLYRESIELSRRALGPEHPDLAHTLNGLALVLRDRGQYAAADSLFHQVLDMRRRLLGDEHPTVATTLGDLGEMHRRLGDYAGAEPLLEEALAIKRRLFPEGHASVRESLQPLAELKDAWQRPDDAARYRAQLRTDAGDE